jgi:protein-disulfide isomerase
METLRRRLPVLLLPLVAGLAGCGHADRPAIAAAGATGGDADVVAEMDGDAIRAPELETRAAAALARIRQEEYDTRKAILDQLLEERLVAREAADRHIAVEALMRQEVDDKAPPPAAAEVGALLEQVKAQTKGRDPAEVRRQIEQSFRERNRQERRAAFVRELKGKYRVRIALIPPRVEVPVPPSAPSLGAEKATVTVVEYLDYQCPYCKRAQATVDELLKSYKGKIRFVHRDFPIQGHPRSFPAAQAARCAGEQGKFWDYHRGMLTSGLPLEDGDLRTLASGLGLKADAFSACVTSGRYDADIKASLQSGATLGVDSTPTFFINGRRLTGARPVAQFQEIIDEELARAGS